ncbi:MAG: LysM peptidoglycan-binding domain-containing protein [Gammaproteobacteria bacterium]|nr:LysM peptidoglycan-binding domain-containing protein [Gammaproteobacteria bacterium]
MNLKFYLFLIFILFLVQGCSSLTHDSVNDPTTTDKDYLSDINTEESEQLSPVDPIIESTHDILQSSPVSQASINKNIDDYLTNNTNNAENTPKHNDVWLRLPELYQFSDINNKRIEQQMKWYLKHKKYLKDVSKRASPFLYFITEEVNKRNMPGEIALLPVIESSFRTDAYSSMKAAGLWQFVPATGKYFGLKQNWWYDGRRDVYHSTKAALTYLEQLHKYYKGDWLLALAAYNAGAGNVNKAIKKNLKKGKPVDYWSLPLPKETYKYIPKLIAISKIVQDQKKLGVNLTPIENTPRLMLVNTKSQIDLSIVAEMSNITLNEIRQYNPAFKQWATDPDGPHHLLIPIDKVELYEKQLAQLDDKDRVKWYRHKIRSGESLSVIARKYKISVSALKTSNHLKNSRIRAGKYLMVPLSSKISMVNQPVKAPSQTVPQNSPVYKVRKGDSFWKIARRFNMSHKQLASLNGLSSGDTLSIGQTLIISKKDETPIKSNNSQKNSTAIQNKSVINYKVKSGDSLYTISKQFKVTINDLKRWNQLNLKKYLKPGQELKVFLTESSQTI